VRTFDRLFAEAAPLIQQCQHERDSPPVEGGGRWPVGICLRPDHASAKTLERAMAEVEGPAGPGHFRTGLVGSGHITVRSLEEYREVVGEDDEAIQRYAGAMGRAAGQVDAIELDLVGLTLTSSAVMVCAVPADDNADRFADLLKDELGDDAWRETGFKRDIWYATILHFAADIAHPAELVDWVAQRRTLDLGRTVIDTAELVRFRYEDGVRGRLMRPEVLASVRTGRPQPMSAGRP
jgi:hypothetical protein